MPGPLPHLRHLRGRTHQHQPLPPGHDAPRRGDPPAYYETVGNRVPGCQECQLCCPHNRMERDSYTDEMARLFSCETLLGAEGEAWGQAEREIHALIGAYGDYENLRAHAILAAGNIKDGKYLPLLRKIAETEEGTNRRYAPWAMETIAGAGN